MSNDKQLKMMNQNYINFSEFILRTPLFSLSSFVKLTAGSTIPDETFKRMFLNEVINESIFLASPSFHNELHKWAENKIDNPSKGEKLKISFLKYLSRMSSRCTPFGLFAGCAVGRFGSVTQIDLSSVTRNRRRTSLDMNFLIEFAQELGNLPEVQKHVLYFPNSSIYFVNQRIRYVEYYYSEGKRYHNVTSVERNNFLDEILEKTKDGLRISEILKLIEDDRIPNEDKHQFVQELIQNQILVSELEPTLSGEEYFIHLRTFLEKIPELHYISEIFTLIEKKLFKIDSTIGNSSTDYLFISEILKESGLKFTLKHLFQVDLIIKPTKNILCSSIINEVSEGLSVLNRLTNPSVKNKLSRFKKAFYKRYEEREIPLLQALDVEMGVGYGESISNDINPLIDDLIFNYDVNTPPQEKVNWTPIDDLINKRFIEAYKTNEFKTILTDEDLENLPKNWEDLPDTFSTIIEIIKTEGTQKIKMDYAFGSSAANLLSRFAHSDENIDELVKTIVKKEKKINSNKIGAEIIHLPESRTGNILLRPDVRDYEIPYLARSSKKRQNQIHMEDIYISMKGGEKLKLTSKKLGREISPYLTNAHNYKYNSLPVYNFLCDMQNAGKRNQIGLNLSPFFYQYDYIPRIEYKNIILSVAKWHIRQDDIKKILEYLGNHTLLMREIKAFQNLRKIPQYVLLLEGDNELLIDLANEMSAKMLFTTVRHYQRFTLSEFLSVEDGIVKNTSREHYTNQIIMSFFKKKRDEK